ncbi:MAG: CehA/McbA family metallohydrolase [Pseudomonadota bacterium]|nr:CehA/McbA family metallohydrolase [Pseudomonadota bacterium]
MPDLSPFSLPGRFWRGNLHTHSSLSDGARPLEATVRAYQEAGYDFVQLSEHFTARYRWPIADTRQWRSNTFTTLIGAELHAPATSAGELWHILATGLPHEFEPAAKHESGPELAKRAAAAGAFVGIAHPAWSQLTLDDGRAIASAHAVEIYNHGCAVETDRGDGWYLLDQLLGPDRRLGAFATDDAHFKTDDAFGGWVQVRADALDPATLLEALKNGQYYSSQGPQIHELSLDGDELTIGCSPVNAISVMGNNSRTVGRFGRAITGATVRLADLEKSWVEVQRSPWLRIAVIDAAGKRAWTNPIWRDEL